MLRSKVATFDHPISNDTKTYENIKQLPWAKDNWVLVRLTILQLEKLKSATKKCVWCKSTIITRHDRYW